MLTITENITHRVTDLAGVEKLEGFSPKELLSDVFKKHKSEEVEEYFTVGVPSTTPDITEVNTTWPRPWVFFRMFLFAVLVTTGLYQILTFYGNPIALPGMLMTGSFVVPTAALIFFVEMNARRNVSLYQILRLAFSGGVMAMGFTMFMSQALLLYPSGWMLPVIAGPIEEMAKLLALVLVIFNTKYRYTLNGLLFGAAIGTGFAALESAGYAFRVLWDSRLPRVFWTNASILFIIVSLPRLPAAGRHRFFSI